MTLAVQDHVEFYSSPNLISWKRESDFGNESGGHGGVWECPDLFQLNVVGSDEKQWVLLVSINPGGPNGGSATQYFVGDFDGNKFTTKQSDTKWIDYGRDNYAGVTWSNIPESDGRRLFLGWMNNWAYANNVPTVKWRGAMTIPRELILEKVDGEFVVASLPVTELEKIRNRKVELSSKLISGSVSLDMQNINPMRSEIIANFQLKNDSQIGIAEEFGIKFSNEEDETFKIAYSSSSNTFYTDRFKGGVNSFSDNFASKSISRYNPGEEVEIRLYVDVASVEVFVDGGKLVFTDIVFPSQPYNNVELFSTNGSVELSKAQIWSLTSIW